MITETPDVTIAVLEFRPYWGPELKRQFANTPFGIRECRSVSGVDDVVCDFHPVLLIIDLEIGIEDCLGWLGQRFPADSRRFPIIVCGSPASLEFEWLLRELGVAEFLPDVIPGDQFARLCRWQLGLQPNGSSSLPSYR